MLYTLCAIWLLLLCWPTTVNVALLDMYIV